MQSQSKAIDMRWRTDGRTHGQLSNLRFAPALNEPLRNNYSMFNEECVEIPIFLEISWKSWGEGLEKLV